MFLHENLNLGKTSDKADGIGPEQGCGKGPRSIITNSNLKWPESRITGVLRLPYLGISSLFRDFELGFRDLV